MNVRQLLTVGAFASVFAAGTAQAAVIAGPVLDIPGRQWSVTGLGFQALKNTSLTSFTYQNQDVADTVILTDSNGNILDSIATAANDPSDTVSVNWALTSGNTYFLLQTDASNELYAGYGGALPSDGDIAIVISGVFDTTIDGAVTDSRGFGSNDDWAAFDNITTSSGVPEPSIWAMMCVGLMGVGALLRRRATVTARA